MRSWTDAWNEPALNVVNLLWLTAILDGAREQGIDVILEGGSGNGTISWETHAIFSHLRHQGQWLKLAKTGYLLRKNGGTSIRQVIKATFGEVLPLWAHRMLIPSIYLNNPYVPLAHPELISRSGLHEKISQQMFGRTSSRIADERAAYLEQVDLGPIHAAIQARSKVEFRDPTADKRIYDFCFSIPPEQYVVDGHSRSLVRRAMKGRLPEATLARYRRGVQGADWYLSIKDALPSLREEVALQEQSPVARQIVDIPKVQALLNTWPESGYETSEVVLKWHVTLTRAISMGYFLRSHDSMNSATAVSIEPPALPSVRD